MFNLEEGEFCWRKRGSGDYTSGPSLSWLYLCLEITCVRKIVGEFGHQIKWVRPMMLRVGFGSLVCL